MTAKAREILGHAWLGLSLLAGGCASPGPPPPTEPVPPLLGPWSAPPTSLPWCEVVFDSDSLPCNGSVHAIFPDHMQFQADVAWRLNHGELQGVRKDSETLALLHVEHGRLKGELRVGHPVISGDGHGAVSHRETLSFDGSPRRARIPYPPGAKLQEYQSDQITAIAGRMLHCEIFRYSAPGNCESFFREHLRSGPGPLAAVSDGLQVVVQPKPSGFDVWMERPTP